jgi:hypothetical protein
MRPKQGRKELAQGPKSASPNWVRTPVLQLPVYTLPFMEFPPPSLFATILLPCTTALLLPEQPKCPAQGNSLTSSQFGRSNQMQGVWGELLSGSSLVSSHLQDKKIALDPCGALWGNVT